MCRRKYEKPIWAKIAFPAPLGQTYERRSTGVPRIYARVGADQAGALGLSRRQAQHGGSVLEHGFSNLAAGKHSGQFFRSFLIPRQGFYGGDGAAGARGFLHVEMPVSK